MKLANIEAGRGLAALLVVLYHVDKYYIGAAGYWPESQLAQLFRFGHAGVEFFFVLSGYIMLTVHWRDIGRPEAVAGFLRKRFERIYPLFWAVLLVSLALFAMLPASTGSHRDPLTLIESALLIGREPLHAAVFVSWSLWHEVLFYGFCALVIWRPRWGLTAFAAWTLACAASGVLGLRWVGPAYWTGSINVLFALGAASAFLLRRYVIPAPRLVLALGVVLFLGTGLAANVHPIVRWVEEGLFGLGSAIVLLGGVACERKGLLRAPAWMETLGAASYAIYLTHMLTLPVLVKAAVRVGASHVMPPALAFVGLSAAAVFVGVAVYRLIDLPIARLLRGLRYPAPAPVSA